MGHRRKDLQLSKLLLDQTNARLGREQPNQETTQRALANLMRDQFLPIVEDIVREGLDPTALFAVVPTEVRGEQYSVIEGNRRLLALKALDRPAIVEGVLTIGRQRRLSSLSDEFHSAPISAIPCVIFDTEREASRWIELRHTGANGGIGLVEWNSDDKDRYLSRHADQTGRGRSPAGQLIDFVDSYSPPDVHQTARILSNVQRLVGSTIIRSAFGIEVKARTVESWYPADEFIKCWAPILADLRAKRIKVRDIYEDEDKRRFLQTLPPERVPDQSLRLTQPIPLANLQNHRGINDSETGNDPSDQADESGQSSDDGSSDASNNNASDRTKADSSGETKGTADGDSGDSGSSAGATKSRARAPSPRPSVIPPSCSLWIPNGRINEIYRELIDLSVEDFTNAAGVLLRVFLELSVDSFLLSYGLVSEAERREASLAKRLKTLVEHMAATGEITPQLEKAMKQVAEGSSVVAASATTFNQYVHNPYSFPKATDVRLAWDELQPLLVALWKKGRKR